jgi:uncharacterized protein YhjY with autotransporter beta-barrel domain
MRFAPPVTLCRRLALGWLLAALATTAPAAAQTTEFVLEPVGATAFDLDLEQPTFTLRVRLLGAPGQPIGGTGIAWTATRGTGRVTPNSTSSTTNSQGEATATFTATAAGTIEISAVAERGSNTVRFRIEAISTAPPPPPQSRVSSLQAVTPSPLALVLGDQQLFQVRVLDQDGQPLAGIGLTWAVEQHPGAPSGPNSTTASDAAGIATGTFGFPVTGRTVIAVSYAGVTPVRFGVDTGSLGELAPGSQSYRSVGAAFDAICAEVFSTPTPDATPLCVFMTGTLSTRSQRSDAVEELTATGLGAQTSAATAGLAGQLDAIASRLSALRGGALRQSLGQIALSLDGGTVTDGLLAAARADAARREAFGLRLEQQLVRLYAGLDSGDAPAAAPAAAAEPKRDRPWGFFVNGRLSQGERDRGVDETGFDFDTTGLTLGFDRAVGANSFFGVALSALDNQTDLADAGGELDVSGLALTLYGIWEAGDNGYFQATATYGQNQYEQARRMELPVVGTLVARADFDGDQLAGTLEGGWSWDGARGTATLFGRGSYAAAEVDAFRETGATASLPGTGFGAVDFGIAVEAQELTSLVGEVGVDFARVFQFSRGLFVPQLNASYLHEFDDDAQRIRGRFLGDIAAASSFDIYTDAPDRDFFNVGASLRLQFLWGSLFVAYDRELDRDDFDLETFNAGLRFEL